MERPIVLLGGGGHCQSVIDIIEGKKMKILGILDKESEVGKKICGHEIIGTDDDIPALINKVNFVITVGFINDPTTRIRLFHTVKKYHGSFSTIIAETAHVSPHAIIGEGCVIMHHALINTGAHIGDNVIINSFADIEHNVVVSDQCHISTGAIVNGNCIIGGNVFIGSHAVVSNGLLIAENTIIGAGSVVVKNINSCGTYVGNPAKRIQRF